MRSSTTFARFIAAILVAGFVPVSTCLGSNTTVNLFPPALNPVGSAPVSVAVADFNGDGNQDLAVANYNSNTVSILLGNKNGTFQPQVTYKLRSLPQPARVTKCFPSIQGRTSLP